MSHPHPLVRRQDEPLDEGAIPVPPVGSLGRALLVVALLEQVRVLAAEEPALADVASTTATLKPQAVALVEARKPRDPRCR